jgi:hypothetical protein
MALEPSPSAGQAGPVHLLTRRPRSRPTRRHHRSCADSASVANPQVVAGRKAYAMDQFRNRIPGASSRRRRSVIRPVQGRELSTSENDLLCKRDADGAEPRTRAEVPFGAGTAERQSVVRSRGSVRPVHGEIAESVRLRSRGHPPLPQLAAIRSVPPENPARRYRCSRSFAANQRHFGGHPMRFPPVMSDGGAGYARSARTRHQCIARVSPP